MTRPTIILVHGLWMTGLEMSYLRHRLVERGYRVVTFRYRMVTRSLAFNRRRLAAFIRKTAHEHGEPVHLIGHSLGGVLALHALRRYPGLRVSRVICLGSPLVDTSAGRVLESWGDTGKALLGKTLPEAVFRTPLGRWEGEQSVGVIAGTQGQGMGNFVARLPKPNDGVVALRETRLPGIADHLEVPLGHTRLVYSDRVVEQCDAFLRDGRFSR